MLDVIIYEDDEVSIKENKKIVNRSLVDKDIDYQIHIFRKCDSKFTKLINSNSKKIFIINIETNNKHGIEVAAVVRKMNFDNVIILTANCGKYYKYVFNNKLIAFDYICKNKDYSNKLCNSVIDAIKFIQKDDVFVFKYKSIIYRILFNDINYIEKETSVKRCIIHTPEQDYYIVSSIDRLNNMLRSNFVKTHQSCIVNTNNIKMLDCVNNRVIFNDNSYTGLVTEKAKREIKEYLFNN